MPLGVKLGGFDGQWATRLPVAEAEFLVATYCISGKNHIFKIFLLTPPIYESYNALVVDNDGYI